MSTEKTRYTDEELEEFKALILKKKGEAEEQLAYYKQQLLEFADNPDAKVKGLDDGTGTAETERVNELAGRQKKFIKHLDNALIRIQNKVYGICSETGKLISKERLRVVPHSTKSMEAKMSQSKKK